MNADEIRQLTDAIYFLASCLWRGLLGLSIMVAAHGMFTRNK